MLEEHYKDKEMLGINNIRCNRRCHWRRCHWGKSGRSIGHLRSKWSSSILSPRHHGCGAWRDGLCIGITLFEFLVITIPIMVCTRLINGFISRFYGKVTETSLFLIMRKCRMPNIRHSVPHSADGRISRY